MRKPSASEGERNDLGDRGELLQLMRGLDGRFDRLEESQTELR